MSVSMDERELQELAQQHDAIIVYAYDGDRGRPMLMKFTYCDEGYTSVSVFSSQGETEGFWFVDSDALRVALKDARVINS